MKLLAWEESFLASIFKSRAVEIKIIKWATVMRALNISMQDCIPLLCNGTIFITYYYANRDAEGQPPPLRADMVFAVIGLTAALSRCLGFYLPQCIQAVSE